ncbi:hypothetical protein D3C76_1611100 [compost metagenome]
MRRQRQLQKDTVDAVVIVQLGDELEQLRLCCAGTQAIFKRADAGFFGTQNFVANVDLTGRILANQNYRQRRFDTIGFEA